MDIGEWLRQLSLARYEAAFRENEIDFEILPKLTATDLKELGVAAVGHRRKLLAAIAELSCAPLAAASESRPAPILGVAGAERRQLTVMVCDLVGSLWRRGSPEPNTSTRRSRFTIRRKTNERRDTAVTIGVLP